MNTTKTFASRDSATAALRKLGVDKRDYNMFIAKNGDKFVVDLGAAQDHVEGRAAGEEALAQEQREADKKANEAVKAEVKPSHKSGRVSVAVRARELIINGMSNVEVFEVLVKEFGLSADKKHYPGWYRSQLKRDGKLVK